MFSNVFKGKTVFITGHTGFKGGWLSAWLLKMGANVAGFSRDVPTKPSIFEVLGLENKIKHIVGDVRDLKALQSAIDDVKPDFVFHLAAQAIVSTSYSDPVDTISTNAIGTMNVLESLRSTQKSCVAVMITSDKCYDNVEWPWGYRETDALGGKDIYSGSKGAAELVVKSYCHSFFQQDHPVKIGVGRAGNVIGGGDWAKDRIVVDCVQSWSRGESVEIRSPKATRPWQHVLEPLSGYLTLAESLANQSDLHGETFNFGPRAEQNRTVVQLLTDLHKTWESTSVEKAYDVTDNIPFHEAGLLKLNCDKALLHLQWESNLDYAETIEMVGTWYSNFYSEKTDMYDFTLQQIASYEGLAKERQRVWSQK